MAVRFHLNQPIHILDYYNQLKSQTVYCEDCRKIIFPITYAARQCAPCPCLQCHRLLNWSCSNFIVSSQWNWGWEHGLSADSTKIFRSCQSHVSPMSVTFLTLFVTFSVTIACMYMKHDNINDFNSAYLCHIKFVSHVIMKVVKIERNFCEIMRTKSKQHARGLGHMTIKKCTDWLWIINASKNPWNSRDLII